MPIIKYKKRKDGKTNSRIAYNNHKGRSIEERPYSPEERYSGCWEMDIVVGGKGKKGALLVLTERYSRKEIIILLPDKTQGSVIGALDGLERKYGANFSKIFKDITVDNGVEFLNMEGLERSVFDETAKRTTNEIFLEQLKMLKYR